MEVESYTLESGIDVGQGITVGPGKFVKKNKRRALNKRRFSAYKFIHKYNHNLSQKVLQK